MSKDINVTDGTVLETLNNKVDLDGGNYAGSGLESYIKPELANKLDKSQITNCLLEIPQNIKLELKNGTLTLKAGSKVIVPNGFEADGTTPKFDEVVIESDMAYNNREVEIGTGVYLVHYNTTELGYSYAPYAASGTTIPTLKGLFYDTANNIVKWNNNGTLIGGKRSLPFAVVSITQGSGVVSIDQVFNGMGYIGSIKWLDTGVVGLATNGKNADGSLNNIEWETNSILLKDTGATGSAEYFDIYTIDGLWFNTLSYTVSNTEPTIKTNAYWWYNPSTNEHFRSNGTQWVKINATAIGSSSKVNGSIVSFTTKQPFRAVDYNDFEKTPRLVEVYLNGKSGYHVYSNGYCEQWGYLAAGTANYTGVTVTLLKPFKDTNYNITDSVATKNDSGNFNIKDFGVADVATSYFTYRLESSNYLQGVYWKACGYIQ